MNAADVIGYTYQADCHCINCTLKAWDEGKFYFKGKPRKGQGTIHLDEGRDENGLPYEAEDSEGNRVHPIFGDEESECVCGDCQEIIMEEATANDSPQAHIRGY